MDTSHDETHAGAEHFCQTMRPYLEEGTTGVHILVAGCGRGHEALYIRKELGVSVKGVDADEHWDSLPSWGADIPDFSLEVCSVLELPFEANSFDFVFYHHVIEHVSDPPASLRELWRVLRPGGRIYIGTPNRHRVVGYLGSFDATALQKIRWNWIDYRARFKGQFRNELGAHAGFSERELASLLQANGFSNVEVLTSSYLRFKYGKKLPAPILRAICRNPVREIAAPSVYYLAQKA